MTDNSVANTMTSGVVSVRPTDSLNEAAQRMRDNDVGDVLIEEDRQVLGIVTDRDVVVRALAEDRDPAETAVRDICSDDLVMLAPDTTVSEAIRAMRSSAVRRLPVVDEGGTVQGFVSLGDLAPMEGSDSALDDISAAPGNS